MEAFAIKNRDTKNIAKIFINEIVSCHSATKILLSDQAKMCKLIEEISSYLTINKINTTAYHPQCNGLNTTEKFNTTYVKYCELIQMKTKLIRTKSLYLLIEQVYKIPL